MRNERIYNDEYFKSLFEGQTKEDLLKRLVSISDDLKEENNYYCFELKYKDLAKIDMVDFNSEESNFESNRDYSEGLKAA
ncbi:MAG: hypothetical protein COB02_15255 [Candidatus Cloacimonadota bacterium]|nr:MAG: hypothetical protein COB02_15255 [Candidatus Cloacimonadota bacterium]